MEDRTDLVELVLALFRVVYRGRVAVLGEMARCYEAVAACSDVQIEWWWWWLTGWLAGRWGLPLFPGPHTTRTFLPELGGWTR